ncbi:MAG TPA: 16S rRNA (guanine(527)-N(7))-methyltransferase RsmG [Anaerolineales bacterium]|jgi:16S rRNA (guanine527-N7)-methyltransferase|nr:16S rRNA (guanine(527)-N(7))-methyltransferase RsmG [Anaerolineales bacterium]
MPEYAGHAEEIVELEVEARGLLNVSLSRRQLQAFEVYAGLLIDWNARSNLTAITKPGDIAVKHFLDSLTCLLAMGTSPNAGRLIDVGSGAGFPGLPIKIACPQLRVTLVESTRKKVEFCQRVVENLGLKDVEVIHGRGEEVGHWDTHREAYDWAVARAVATLPVLVEYLLPFARVGGLAIAQKGETGLAEAHAAEAGLRILGGRIRQLVPVHLPRVAETRYLVVMEKEAATPLDYARRPGIPAKRPLGSVD